MDDPRTDPAAPCAQRDPHDFAPAEADASSLPPLSAHDAIDGWDRLARQLSLALRATAQDAAWLDALRQLAEQVRELARRDADCALYLLVQAAAGDTDRYAAQHALLCAVAAELCAATLDWSADERSALVHSALTMNVAMAELQNALACQLSPVDAIQRGHIQQHAAQGADLLAAAGLRDDLWLAVVRHHHDPQAAGDAAAPARRLAELLHRIDVYTAKLSRRASRDTQSPVVAARDICLPGGDRPDELGAAMLRALGLYPPGCFVQLANGEIAVVVRRGTLMHAPEVMVVRRADGGLCMPPQPRSTASRGAAVRQGVTQQHAKVRLDHWQTLQRRSRAGAAAHLPAAPAGSAAVARVAAVQAAQ
ncbi:MAG TPA: hypothetical protein VFQ16_05320 [Burkholderiaceae bacterium]|nr:hypothetical protein [Burkholderiaceae bacterium]